MRFPLVIRRLNRNFFSQLEAAQAQTLSLFSSSKRHLSSSPPDTNSGETHLPHSLRTSYGRTRLGVVQSVNPSDEEAYIATLRESNSLAGKNQSQVSGESYASRVVSGACFKCGKKGHWAKDCDQSPAAEVEKCCRCGKGSCLVLTAKTEQNRGRKFFTCPIRQENGGCGFFEWCDEPSGNTVSAEDKAWKDGSQQQFNQDPTNQITSDSTKSRNEYDNGTNVQNSSRNFISDQSSAAGVGEVEKCCPCGKGSCLVFTANTERNRGRKFFKCPIRQENGGCGFFEWCDEPSGNTVSAEDKTWKNGSQQQFNQDPTNQITSDFTKSRNEYDNGTNVQNSSYRGAYPKFEAIDTKGNAMNTCFKCGKEGHWARDCQAPPSSNSTSGSVGVKGKLSYSKTCYKCGQSGHWANDCSQSIIA